MIEFRVLGPRDLRDSEGNELRSVLVRPKQLALLAYLALGKPGEWHQRNVLLAMFWPESDERRARFSLRSALHALRTDLGAEAILSRGDEEIAIDRSVLWCDASAFVEHLDAGRLEDALAEYRGPLLDGAVVPGLSEFHAWLDTRRETLRRHAADAAAELARRAESAGDYVSALQWMRRFELLSPYEEVGLRQQLMLLERMGDRVAASRTFEQWTSRLRADLDAEPSPETTALMQRIRSTTGTAQVASTVRVRSPAPHATYDASLTTPSRSNEAAPVSPPSAEPSGAPPPWWRSHTRTLSLGIVGIAVVAAAALTIRTIDRASRARSVASNSGTVVLPFAYAGDAQSAYLGSALSLLMSASLGGTGPMSSVDPRVVASIVGNRPAGVNDLRLGSDVATRVGARYFIAGTVVRAHRTVRVDVALYEAGVNQPLARAVSEGDVDSLFAVADNVTRDLLSTRVTGVSASALGTTSLVALKAYVEGERELLGARYREAAAHFADAVKADSMFARAWFRVGYAGTWGALGGSGPNNATRRAVALSSRLTPRDQQLLAAWHDFSEGRIASANRGYEQFLQADDRHVEAWLQLGELRYHWGAALGYSATDAAAAFRRVLELSPGHGVALIHLARLAAREGDAAVFDSLARAALASSIDSTDVLELRALSAVIRSDSAAFDTVLAASRRRSGATAEILKLLLPGPGDPAYATRAARALLRSDDPESSNFGQLALVQIPAVRGRFREASESIDSFAQRRPILAAQLRAWMALVPQRSSSPDDLRTIRSSLASAPSGSDPYAFTAVYAPRQLYVVGALSIMMGDTAEARRDAERLLSGRWPTGADSASAHHFGRLLRAEATLKAGDPSRALEEMGPPDVEPNNTLPQAMSFVAARERFVRASALEADGQTAEAIRWYSTFPDPSGHDAWFFGAALRRRAALELSGGSADAARRDYARFAELWSAADREFDTEVREARRRATP